MDGIIAQIKHNLHKCRIKYGQITQPIQTKITFFYLCIECYNRSYKDQIIIL